MFSSPLLVVLTLALQGADDSRLWRKASLSDSSISYWWRQGATPDDEPEVTMTAPASDWKVGTLDNGKEYVWREGDNPDNPEIRLTSGAGTASAAAGWKIGVLKSGRRYTWRGDESNQEVRLWEVSQLESGKPFWYTIDGHVSLTDPFDLDRGYIEL